MLSAISPSGTFSAACGADLPWPKMKQPAVKVATRLGAAAKRTMRQVRERGRRAKLAPTRDAEQGRAAGSCQVADKVPRGRRRAHLSVNCHARQKQRQANVPSRLRESRRLSASCQDESVEPLLPTSPNPRYLRPQHIANTAGWVPCGVRSLVAVVARLARPSCRRAPCLSVVHNNRVQTTLRSLCAGARLDSGSNVCAAPRLFSTILAPRSPADVVAKATMVGVGAAVRTRGRPCRATGDQGARAARARRPHVGSGRTTHLSLQDPVA